MSNNTNTCKQISLKVYTASITRINDNVDDEENDNDESNDDESDDDENSL